MKFKASFLMTLFFATLFLISCEEDDPVQTEKFNYWVSDDLLRWISLFEDKKTFLFSNEAGDTNSVNVDLFLEPTPTTWVDCERDGGPKQCELRSATLQFNSTSDTTMYLSLLLIGEDHIRIMPYRGTAITEEVLRLDEDVNEFRVNEKYNATYVEDFNYNGQTAPAFIAENVVEEFLSYVPPKSFTLVKGIGITEWTDFRGNVWKLNE
ncbi:MAG: hypothetical protein AAFZ15_13960 [Bacteroidota bacterium]